MYSNLIAIAVAAISIVTISPAPALSADASSGMPECSKASAMMQNHMAPSPGAMMSDDRPISVDAAYLKSMKAALEQQAGMAKMEVACGKNATVKASAKKSLDAMQPEVDEVQKLLQSIAL